MDDLQNVALGRTPPDRVVRGGRVLTPGTRSLEARDVLVSGGRIAAVIEDGSTAIGDETEVIDAEGQVVVPGFVDAHTHLDVEQAYESAYHLSLRGGTTTVVTEVQDLGVLFGADAVEAMLDATAGLPVSVLATVPPQPLIDTFGESWADERETRRLCDLLARDRVVGVGEIDWIHVVGRDSPVEELIDRARTEHAPVSAHGAGCSGEKLAALAALVDNDHEAISADGIVERVENGIHAIGRTGAIRDDSEAIADAYDRVEPADLSLSSDGIACRTLLEAGHMDAVLRRVIDAGVPPLDAIHMATAVPARHFGLRCGVIAPGRPADLVVLSDLESVAVDTVLSGGEVVVRAGDALVGPRRHEYPRAFYDSVTVDVDASRFEVPDPGGPVRAIRYEGGLLSCETVVEPPREDGALSADPARDLCKATVIDRHPDGDGRGFTGFVTGFGIERGAVATTLSWEVPGLLVVGTDDDAMRRAACRVRELRGGWAVVEEGAVAADLPMPVGGYAATLPIEETADRLDAVRAAIRALGSDVEAAMIGIQTLTFPGVPSLKLSPSGYADIRHRRIVGLAVE